jgi:ribose 5-phosphate isomerase B
MRIALGSDHRGDAAAKVLLAHLTSSGHQIVAQHECHGQACDYPDNAFLVSTAVRDGKADRGILICGSGIGVSIAANKVHGVRAGLVYDELAAGMSRSHNDCNVLCLSADTTPTKEMITIIDVWLKTDFEGGRHLRRVKKIQAIEDGLSPVNVS